MKLATSCLVAVLCVGLGGCAFTMPGKKRTVSVPPAPLPAGLPAPLPSPSPVPPAGAHPVPVEETAPAQPPPEPLPPITRTAPAPKPATQAPGRRNPPNPVPAEPNPPAAEAAPLRLGAILTPERQRQYQADLARSLAAARTATSQAGTATVLTPTQRETVDRIETFIEQAEGMAEQDLATAVQIARRAELLGQELTRSLR